MYPIWLVEWEAELPGREAPMLRRVKPERVGCVPVPSLLPKEERPSASPHSGWFGRVLAKFGPCADFVLSDLIKRGYQIRVRILVDQ